MSGNISSFWQDPLDGVRHRLGVALVSLPFYRATRQLKSPFAAKPVRALSAPPPEPWPGDSARGEACLRGELRFADAIVQAAPEALKPPYIVTLPAAPWRAAHAGPRWFASLHGFSWFDDLRALGSDEAKRAARGYLVGWLRARGRYPAIVWRADVSGRRLVSWITHFEFLCNGIDAAFRYWLTYELMGEARHLARTYMFARGGAGRIAAIKGLLYAACCLPSRRRAPERWTRKLETEVGRQFLADGGHVDRNPSRLFALFRDLVDIEAMLGRAGRERPAFLRDAIERSATMLRGLRHGDGGLGLFHGGAEEAGWLIDMALARAETQARPPLAQGPSGFERLAAGRTTVLVDAGPPPKGPGATPHAGTLSLEVSIGRNRLITNMGAAFTDNRDWRRAQRATAAHSTLTIDDLNSSEIREADGLGRHPRAIGRERDESEDGIWLATSHDGYGPNLGFIHRRRIFLSADGTDLRGEDMLEPVRPSRGRPRRFAVRFHLHPQVKASLAEDPNQVLLRLPNGEGWRFRCRGGRVSLAESVYLGRADSRLPTEQIVVEGEISRTDDRAAPAPLRWALRKIEGA